MEETREPLIEADEVTALHDDIIRRFGGRIGILSRPLLESALSRPFISLADGTSPYPTLIEKAAVLFEGMVKNHAFVDGNKRTAAIAVSEFMRRKQVPLEFSDEEIEDLCIRTASGEMNSGEILEWFRRHVRNPRGRS